MDMTFATTFASAASSGTLESPGRADAPALMAHLLALDANDRSLRFCANHVSDSAIAQYVYSIRFGLDSVLVLRDDAQRVIALAHGAPYESAAGRCGEASFSVSHEWRNLGLCKRLFDELQRRAHREGTLVVVAQCRLVNRPMRRVFTQAGMTVTFDRDEVHARARPTGLPWFAMRTPA